MNKKNGFTKYQQDIISAVDEMMKDNPLNFGLSCLLVAKDKKSTYAYVYDTYLSYKKMVMITK